jgi:hypothetical protein
LTNSKNLISGRIKPRIAAANKCYYNLRQIFRSTAISKAVVVYGSETWAMTEMDMKKLGTWERKILRRIYGTVEEQGIWRIRTNQELREQYKDLDTVEAINPLVPELFFKFLHTLYLKCE